MAFRFSATGPGSHTPDGCAVELYRQLPAESRRQLPAELAESLPIKRFIAADVARSAELPKRAGSKPGSWNASCPLSRAAPGGVLIHGLYAHTLCA